MPSAPSVGLTPPPPHIHMAHEHDRLALLWHFCCGFWRRGGRGGDLTLALPFLLPRDFSPLLLLPPPAGKPSGCFLGVARLSHRDIGIRHGRWTHFMLQSCTVGRVLHPKIASECTYSTKNTNVCMSHTKLCSESCRFKFRNLFRWKICEKAVSLHVRNVPYYFPPPPPRPFLPLLCFSPSAVAETS